MASYALPLKTLGDALFLRNRIIARLEQAELQPDVHHRRWLTRFVVVGGGFSGVETAGELADFISASLPYYRHISRDDVEIILIHNGERLLPEMSTHLGNFTLRRMRFRGIHVRLNTRVIGVTDLGVELDRGESLAAGTIICTIGTQPNALLESIPAQKSRGRLVLNPDLSVPGVDSVWAAGDCAAVVNEVDGKVCPPTAQFAHAQAITLAANIVASIKRQPTRPFSYYPKGQLSSVGHTQAVAEIYGWKVSGFIAWLMWRWIYLMRIPTFSRKSRLFLEWSWAMFFPPDIAHFAYRRSPRHGSGAALGAQVVEHPEPMQPPGMPNSALRCEQRAETDGLGPLKSDDV